MSNLLTQLTFGLTAAATVGFYYLAAAPPAVAQVNVCGPGNFSDSCASDSQTSPPPSDTISTVYTRAATQSSTSIPEPSTTIALLMTGAGIIYSAKKRKEIGQGR